MDMWAGINHSQPAEANGCPDAVSWGVLARVAGGESVHRPNAAAHPQRQSSTRGADCWPEWQEMGGWPVTTLSIHNELLQARTFNWSMHVVLVPNPHRRHIWLEWKQLLEHFPDPVALKWEIKKTFWCWCTGGNRKDTCGQRCTTVWRATHSPVWFYRVVPPGRRPVQTHKIRNKWFCCTYVKLLLYVYFFKNYNGI